VPDLRQPPEAGAALAQDVGEAANAVEFRVTKIDPFRIGFPRSQAPETDADVFAQFFRGKKPRLDRIERSLAHIIWSRRLWVG